MPYYETTVGKSDLEIGQEYFGSYVKKVWHEVLEDKEEKYKIKRFVRLTNGIVLVEEYTRVKTIFEDEVSKSKKPFFLGSKNEEPKTPDPRKKKVVGGKNRPNLDELYDVPAKAYPYSKLPEDQPKGAPIAGAWKHSDETDDSNWDPMDVIITKEKPAFLGVDEPNGIVALRIGALPDEDGMVDPFDLKYFPPGEEEPCFGFYTIGHWTPAKQDQKWPPVQEEEVEAESDQQPEVEIDQKPKLPNLDGESARVVPQSQAPATQDEDEPLTGVWKHDDDTDDTDWEPLMVDITKDYPLDLEPGAPHGIVAVEDGVEPNEDGTVNPSDLKFFPPFKEPPSNFQQLGYWKPGKLDIEWPPKKPKPKKAIVKPGKLILPDFDNVDATVIPRSKLPRSESERPDNNSTPLTGVWKHNKDVADFDWDPLDVVITKKPPLFLEKGEPHGLVAVPKDAKPNRVGKIDPADLNFFTPGEKPPSGYKKVGHWRPGKLTMEWPPGKPILPDFNGPARVFPTSKAPSRLEKDDPTTGVWKHNDDTDDSEWEPLDVEISEKYPSDLGPDEHHGLVAVEDGVRPDASTGKLKPSDLKFFIPGENPPPEYNKVGHWRHRKLNQPWPPVKRKLPNFDGPAMVVPKSKAPYQQVEDTPLTGVWKHTDGTDDTDWDSLDVIISKEPAAFLEPDEPQGLVAVKEDVRPNPDGTVDPSDICFFKPGEKPPQDYEKVGHWRPGKLNYDWPPVKPKLPDFNGPAKVWPRSSAPHNQSKRTPLAGVWKHNDDLDDSDWDPLNVFVSKDEPTVYAGDPHGIVAVDENVKPNADGTVDPKDICFFLPDEEPPLNFNKVGFWKPVLPPSPKKPSPKKIARDLGEAEFPSLDGDIAKVVPKSKIEHRSIKDPKLVGVWEHNDDTDDSDWEPLHVIISNDPPPDTAFSGIVAVEEGVKLNAVGKLDPADLKFFTPGEDPPTTYRKLGHWVPVEKSAWPPVKPSIKNVRIVGKLNLPNFDGIPEIGVIFSRSQAPDSHDDGKGQIVAKGIWKWSNPENKPEDAESWIPSKVDMCETGNEPPDWHDDEEQGVWGVNPNADENEYTKPTDIWFYPPNEKPDEGFVPIGKWRPRKREWSYPPKPIGKVEDKRKFKEFTRSQNKVGKLRIPSFYKGK